jgi:hypothetical protein
MAGDPSTAPAGGGSQNVPGIRTSPTSEEPLEESLAQKRIPRRQITRAKIAGTSHAPMSSPAPVPCLSAGIEALVKSTYHPNQPTTSSTLVGTGCALQLSRHPSYKPNHAPMNGAGRFRTLRFHHGNWRDANFANSCGRATKTHPALYIVFKKRSAKYHDDRAASGLHDRPNVSTLRFRAVIGPSAPPTFGVGTRVEPCWSTFSMPHVYLHQEGPWQLRIAGYRRREGREM